MMNQQPGQRLGMGDSSSGIPQQMMMAPSTSNMHQVGLLKF